MTYGLRQAALKEKIEEKDDNLRQYALVSEIADLTNEVDELKSGLAMRKELTTEITGLETDINRLEADMIVAGKKDEKKSLKEYKKEKATRIAKNEKNLDKLNDLKKEIEVSIASVSGGLDMLQKDTSVKQTDMEVEIKEAEIKESVEELAKLQKDLQKTDTAIQLIETINKLDKAGNYAKSRKTTKKLLDLELGEAKQELQESEAQGTETDINKKIEDINSNIIELQKEQEKIEENIAKAA
ncbi:MAG: hypothetical protein KAJ10_15235, partial [Thermodesulfovibrionia bacterium]|nr:hypothetical protein [Thermodesulfovibrionia bacterium]